MRRALGRCHQDLLPGPSCRTTCCAQQTGMHILVVEALLIATYSTWGRANTYTHKKPCRSRACLVRIAGPCPAVSVQLVPAQLGLSPAGPYQLWCTTLRIATDTRRTRNTTKDQKHVTWTCVILLGRRRPWIMKACHRASLRHR